MKPFPIRKRNTAGILLAVVAAAMLALAAGSAVAAGALVDLNTADVKALEALPGVGPATAQAIVAGRPYKSVDALSGVKGIGKAKLDKIRPLVTVGGAAAAAPVPPAAAKAAGAAASKAGAAADKTGAAASKAGAAAAKAGAAASAAKAAPAEAKRAAKAAAPAGPVNLNTATQAELEALPGIGPAKAKAIIDGRPYQKPEDVMKVRGIKQGIYKKIEGMITVR